MNTCDLEGVGVTFPGIMHGRPVRTRSARMDSIVAFVSRETGVGARDILGDSRMQHIAHARQMVMFLAAEEGMSLSQIGRCLGRDHTSVSHGIRAHRGRME